MGLAETTYKGNQSGKSVDVDSGVALYCEPRRSRHVRDRGGHARQISHKTSGGQTMSPCADPAYGEQGPAKLSRHKAAKPLNLDHAAKPRSHKATCRHCPLALVNATKGQSRKKRKTWLNLSAQRARPRLHATHWHAWQAMNRGFGALVRFGALRRCDALRRFHAAIRFVGFKRLDALRRFEMLRRFDACRRLDALGATKDIGCSLNRKTGWYPKVRF